MENNVLGAHQVHYQGDLVKLQLFGPLGEQDIVGLREIVVSVLQKHGLCFLLADATELDTITAPARRAMAQWGQSDPRGRASGVAVHGVSFATRTLLSLTVNAVRLMGYREVAVDLVADEAAALRSISHQRAALVKSTP